MGSRCLKLKTALMQLNKMVGESIFVYPMIEERTPEEISEQAMKYSQVIEEIEAFIIDYPDSKYADDGAPRRYERRPMM